MARKSAALIGKTIFDGLLWSDQKIADFHVDKWERNGSLVNLFFHGIFLDRQEWETQRLYPQQETTLAVFDQIVRYFADHGFRFVSPGQILEGLAPDQKYVSLTFDDGYYNNIRALPVLEKYGAHATVFVSAAHVKLGKAFWWEPLFTKLSEQGKSLEEIALQMSRWNTMRSEEIESGLRREFGPNFLKSQGDANRPFTETELKTFASSKYISIGNHTADHQVLTAYSKEEGFKSICECQDMLQEIIGYRPLAIAYPNGMYSPAILEAASEAGLKLGFTTVPKKEYLPTSLNGAGAMMLGRFMPRGGSDVEGQCRLFRSDAMLTHRMREFKRKFAGAKSSGGYK